MKNIKEKIQNYQIARVETVMLPMFDYDLSRVIWRFNLASIREQVFALYQVPIQTTVLNGIEKS